ncbi:MAG: ShlB/FhaC/HecB family hemolysin secretion/activation protein [Bradyrhizobium sp.]|nr:ShlB/FhaC/HecB family hemolysin secretion/activation protein [Bradyrhizobium sp.]
MRLRIPARVPDDLAWPEIPWVRRVGGAAEAVVDFGSGRFVLSVDLRFSLTGTSERRRGRVGRGYATVAGLGLLLLSGVPAVAQTASQIVPPSFRPDLSHGGGVVVPGGAGLATPAGAEKLTVKLSGVNVVGGLPQLAQATAELKARLSGRRVTGAEIFAAARELEAAYAQAGFVLVRVILPPQHLVNGATLRLVVVDGFIERIETKNLPEQVRQRIERLVGPLTGQRGMTLRELERRVLLAGDTPGVLLRSTLAPGKQEGGTVLVLEATYQPVTGLITVDNTLSQALGQPTLGVGLDLNSVMGAGELIYLRASGYPDGTFLNDNPRDRILAAGINLPLWVDGLSFNAEYTDAHTMPERQVGLQSQSAFDRLSLRLRYAWLRGRSANFNSELAFDAEDESVDIVAAGVPIPLSLDRLRVLRFANDGDVLMPWGATLSGRLTASFGLDGLGARTAADATALLPLSRQGADADFSKLDVSLGYLQPVLEHLVLSASARAQTSFDKPLLLAEQIGIANTSGLSAFDAGTVVGDAGYVVRGEVQSPWALPTPLAGIGAVLAPYLFAAYGEVKLYQPTVLEAGSVRASSYGGGLRIGGAKAGTLMNATLSLEYGHANRTDGGGSDRVTVVSAFRF